MSLSLLLIFSQLHFVCANLRDLLVEGSIPFDPTKFSGGFEAMFRAWPRTSLNFKAAPDTFEPPIDYSLANPYFQGMIWMIAVPVFFAAMSILGCLTFCMARSCWDACGGRKPTKESFPYQKSSTHTIRAALIFLFLLELFFTILATVTNTFVSKSIDNLFLTGDSVVEYIYSYKVLMVQAYNIAVPGRDTTLVVRDLVNTLLPSDTSFIPDKQDCLNSSHQVLIPEGRLAASIEAFLPLDAAGLSSFTSVASAATSLSSTLDSYTLSSANNQLNFIASAFALDTLGKLDATTGDYTTLLNSNSATSGSSASLQAGFSNLLTIADYSGSAWCESLITGLENIETGAATMPNWTALADLIIDPGSTNRFELLAELSKVQTSLDALPDFASVLADLTALGSTQQLVASFAARSQADFTAYDTAVTAADFPALASTIANLDLLLNNPVTLQSTVETALRAVSVSQANTVANAITTAFLDDLALAADVADLFSGFDLAAFNADFASLSVDLGSITCMVSFIDWMASVGQDLLVLHPTLTALASRRNSFRDQGYDSGLIYSSLTSVSSALSALASSLPAFADIRTQLLALQSALRALPDLTAAANEVSSADPLAWFNSNYATLRGTGQGSFSDLRNDVTACETELHGWRVATNSYVAFSSVDAAAYTAGVAALSAAVADPSPLTAALQEVTSLAYDEAQGLSDGTAVKGEGSATAADSAATPAV